MPKYYHETTGNHVEVFELDDLEGTKTASIPGWVVPAIMDGSIPSDSPVHSLAVKDEVTGNVTAVSEQEFEAQYGIRRQT